MGKLTCAVKVGWNWVGEECKVQGTLRMLLCCPLLSDVWACFDARARGLVDERPAPRLLAAARQSARVRLEIIRPIDGDCKMLKSRDSGLLTMRCV